MNIFGIVCFRGDQSRGISLAVERWLQKLRARVEISFTVESNNFYNRHYYFQISQLTGFQLYIIYDIRAGADFNHFMCSEQ